MRKNNGNIVFSPSDLITYLKSPFASWMDRAYLEGLGDLAPDEETDDQKLIAETGNRHEAAVLAAFQTTGTLIEDLRKSSFADALAETKAAVAAKTRIIYQAPLQADNFAGFSDFIMLNDAGSYEVWDTKLARSPKPYYAIQLCCYSEMFAATVGCAMPERFGVILGSKDRITFRVEDFIHFYNRIKSSFLDLQGTFSGDLEDRPEPHARGDHGRWSSHAEEFLDASDHLVRVAGITVGQIKKLKAAGINTLSELACSGEIEVRKLAADTRAKLVEQAMLQQQTRIDRSAYAEAPARFLILRGDDEHEDRGLAALPPANDADVFFDMEGYPLVDEGLEYLFGVTVVDPASGNLKFKDWWAHDRAGEKTAFENFVDWAHSRWLANRGMHIYHYAAYERSALQRLSTFHNTRQDEVDDLLRGEVLVDLYKIVHRGLRIGEENYSIKTVEKLYRPGRKTEVTNATDSIVQYARWIESGEPTDWNESPILKGIRDYNKDDCDSTAELTFWLRKLAADNGIPPSSRAKAKKSAEHTPEARSDDLIEREKIAGELKEKGDDVALVLKDVVDFHRREQKPIHWRVFHRAESSEAELADDNGCIACVKRVGQPAKEKLSMVQLYEFDAAQECKLKAGDDVMFTHCLYKTLEVLELDLKQGRLKLKATQKKLDENFEGEFPLTGSLILSEGVNIKPLQQAVTELAAGYLTGELPPSSRSLLQRDVPSVTMRKAGEDTVAAAIRITSDMNGGCLVIQGPPGTGKTFTASRVIKSLLDAGKKVGVTSNSHKAVTNLLEACGEAVREGGGALRGVKVGNENEGRLFDDNPQFQYVKDTKGAIAAYTEGVIGGTVWLFARSEWKDKLDFLFVDEAGQVNLTNVIVASRSAKNLVLLGDQMQLEQPVQGSHPGDSGMSALQYALKDLGASKQDAPVFHAVVPADYGLFLAESRRMHPEVCRFISESIYENRLTSYADCARQSIATSDDGGVLVQKEFGLLFSGIEHDGNTQQSIEEAERVRTLYEELVGRDYTAADGSIRPLALEDFLFIAPYNAQVRALESVLPDGARIGSVDRFQGQEAPVCILSLCSSFGEYGSRGLPFILDRNRVNVAISRAKCLAIVVADPRIAGADAASLNEMKLLNIFCKLAGQ